MTRFRLAVLLVTLAAAGAAAAQSPRAAPRPARPAAEPRLASIPDPGDRRAARPLPVAAAGFCVVRLRDHREWTAGDLAAGGLFDGREYRFASMRERDIFAATPERYAPALSGDCVATFAETGERVAGRLEFGLVHNGRLYFFATAERRAEFQADPARLIDADLVDGGRCPVSRVDRQRRVAGIPATVALHNGLRYQFASARDRETFLTAPDRYEIVDAKTRVAASDALPLAAAPTPRPSPDDAEPDDVAGEGGAYADVGAESGLGEEPALGGFCPVSIQRDGLWVRGRYDYRVERDGVLLVTAGPEQKQALEEDLARYMPVLGGKCPVSQIDEGVDAAGSPFQSLTYKGRLFLFVDAEHREAFKNEPVKYASIDLAAEGQCVVTKRDAGRSEPGLTNQVVWHHGLIYRFVGPEEKARFLADPDKYAAP
jgi:YHS domain-containing protein